MSPKPTPGTFACTTCWLVKPDSAKGRRFGKRWQCLSCGEIQDAKTAQRLQRKKGRKA